MDNNTALAAYVDESTNKLEKLDLSAPAVQVDRVSKVQRVVEGQGRVMGEEEMKKIFNEVRLDKPEVTYILSNQRSL